MNMRLMFATIAAMALTPMLATHNGFRPSLSAGSGYISDWRVEARGDAGERSVSYECIATGADLVRRAAPAVNGGTATSPSAHRAGGLAPASALVCVNS